MTQAFLPEISGWGGLGSGKSVARPSRLCSGLCSGFGVATGGGACGTDGGWMVLVELIDLFGG